MAASESANAEVGGSLAPRLVPQESCRSDVSTALDVVDSDMVNAAAEEIDRVVTGVVNEVLVNQAIKVAVQDCKFSVTIANPRGKDYPLIAVSEAFETMTGYSRNEILGVNCRFLNQGCDMNPMDLMNLRIASQTGAPFTALLPNRKKSGELFLNLLDVRGLTVARDARTGEDLWFLIGIQADVSGLADDEIPEDHLAELQVLADGIRARIVTEISKFAVASAVAAQDALEAPPSWVLLEKPCWRPGAPLGERRPTDSPAAVFMTERGSMITGNSAASTSTSAPHADRAAVQESRGVEKRTASQSGGQSSSAVIAGPQTASAEAKPAGADLPPLDPGSSKEDTLVTSSPSLERSHVTLALGVLLLGGALAMVIQRKLARR